MNYCVYNVFMFYKRRPTFITVISLLSFSYEKVLKLALFLLHGY
jgi:hypothetical protein